jgi:hypothetical protein
MAVNHGDGEVGIVVEEWDDLFRRDGFGNMRVAVQIALPQHSPDLLGNTADDAAAHDAAPGVLPEIGLG